MGKRKAFFRLGISFLSLPPLSCIHCIEHFQKKKNSKMAAALPAYDMSLDEMSMALSYVTISLGGAAAPAAPAAPAPKKDKKKDKKKKEEDDDFDVFGDDDDDAEKEEEP